MEKVRCPKCGSTDTAPLLFNFPIADRDYDGYILAGDVCYGDERDPDYGCRNCGHRWWKDNQCKNDDTIPEFLRDFMVQN